MSQRPTYFHAQRVIHCSVEGEEDLIEVFTPDSWLVITVDGAEITHRNYHVRQEHGIRWHPKENR